MKKSHIEVFLSKIKDTLLVAGLLLAASTQLRIPGVPVGPGELCIAGWIFCAIIRFAMRFDAPLPKALAPLAAFWGLMFIAMSIGTMTAYVTGDRHDSSLFRHDIIAYVLMTLISVLSVVEKNAQARSTQVSWLLVTLGSVFLAAQLIHAFAPVDIEEIQPWFYHRFRGWSENSNSLGMLCLVLAFLPLHLAEQSTRFGAKLLALSCVIIPVVAGILTDSDSFKLGLIAGCATLVLLKISNSLFLKSGSPTMSSLSSLAIVLAIPVFLIAASPIAWTLASGSGNQFVSEKKSAVLMADATDRFQLWNQAFIRAAQSGMLGLGPGPHLEMPRQHMLPSNEPNTDLAPPPPEFEAHNTLLDLLVQGGILAALSVIWLGTFAAKTALKAGKHMLVALLVAIAAFSMTHLIIRTPAVWFVIATCLVARQTRNGPAQTLAFAPPISRLQVPLPNTS